MERHRKAALVILWASLVAGALYRLQVAFTDDGIFWPDEVYQSLEPAHRLVFGYGLIPWEFAEGARSWAFPGFLALLLKACAVLGLDEPRQYLGVVRVVFVGIAVATAWASCHLARSQGASQLAAAVGASCFALGSLPLYFGHRAMSETACALPVTLGLWLTLRSDATRGLLVAGASLLGMAVFVRLQCGLFAASAVAILLARRQWRSAQYVFGTLCVGALLFGALDKLTWGGWFHSALEYFEFNLVQDKTEVWGHQPWHHLVLHLFASMTGLTLVFAVSLVAALRKATGLALLVLVFFALHSAMPHKEIRFILPVLPLLGACVAVALTRTREVICNRVLAPLVLLCGVASMAGARALTFEDLGAYPERSWYSAWDYQGSVNRLLLAAHRREDLCGIRIDGAPIAWSGGSTYLHKHVHLYGQRQPPEESRLFNYIITEAGSGRQRIARDGFFELVYLPVSPCDVDLAYSWRLP